MFAGRNGCIRLATVLTRAELVVRGLKAEHVNIIKSHAEHVNIVEHEKKFQELKRSEKCSTQAPKGIC